MTESKFRTFSAP